MKQWLPLLLNFEFNSWILDSHPAHLKMCLSGAFWSLSLGLWHTYLTDRLNVIGRANVSSVPFLFAALIRLLLLHKSKMPNIHRIAFKSWPICSPTAGWFWLTDYLSSKQHHLSYDFVVYWSKRSDEIANGNSWQLRILKCAYKNILDLWSSDQVLRIALYSWNCCLLVGCKFLE